MPARLTTDGRRLVVSGVNASISVVDILEPAWLQVTSRLLTTLMDHAVIQQFGEDSRYPGLKRPLIWLYDAAVFGPRVLRSRVLGGLEVSRMP